MMNRILFLLFCLFAVIPAHGANVYLTDSEENSQNLGLVAMLTGAGHSVLVGAPWYDLDGTQDFSGFDLVLLQVNYNYSGGSMPLEGQTALTGFVRAGGGIVTTAWLNYNVEGYPDYATLAALLPVTSPDADYESSESVNFSVVSHHPAITKGLPSSFTFSPEDIFGTESRLIAKPGAIVFCNTSTLFPGNTAGVGLAGWYFGAGRVASFSTTCGESDFSSALFRQLFLNAIDWTLQPDSTPQLTVSGGFSPKFKTPKAIVRGKASDPAGIESVTYRVGSKGSFRATQGTTSWRFKTKLKAKRTKVTMVVVNGDGITTSRLVKLKLKR